MYDPAPCCHDSIPRSVYSGAAPRCTAERRAATRMDGRRVRPLRKARRHRLYPGAVERAIRREPAGLAELFRYTVIGELDGEAGEAHAAILLGLLERWGDRRFAHVLRAQKLGISKAVIDTIPMPPGSRLQFPLTYASAHH